MKSILSYWRPNYTNAEALSHNLAFIRSDEAILNAVADVVAPVLHASKIIKYYVNNLVPRRMARNSSSDSVVWVGCVPRVPKSLFAHTVLVNAKVNLKRAVFCCNHLLDDSYDYFVVHNSKENGHQMLDVADNLNITSKIWSSRFFRACAYFLTLQCLLHQILLRFCRLL